jgi:hypothetical protein
METMSPINKIWTHATRTVEKRFRKSRLPWGFPIKVTKSTAAGIISASRRESTTGHSAKIT